MNEKDLPPVIMPGFLTLRLGNGETITLVIAEESRDALRQLLIRRLWTAPIPITQAEIGDSMGNRFYWNSHTQ